MDDDIGYLKGSETEKIMPVLRGLLDNVENLLPNSPSHMTKDGVTVTPLDGLMAQGIFSAQALAYMRGRSVVKQFMLIDEVQNASPSQVLSIVSRAGDGSKVVLMGDVDQIDHPYLDKRNNGLTYVAERMRGSALCRQVAFYDSECTRSPLASEAITRLTPKGVL
jgi:PhoH-like ATPase